MKELLLKLKIVQKRNSKYCPWNEEVRVNPKNPLSYLILFLILPIAYVAEGWYETNRSLQRIFKWE